MSDEGPDNKGTPTRRLVFFSLGMVCVALGALGILLPLLPTTPFLLLAAYLLARSSARWHKWLISNRHLGPYINAVRSNAGLTSSQKIRICASFTTLFAVSIYFVPGATIKIVLAAWWLFWIVFILRLKAAATPALAEEFAEPRS